MELTTTQVSLIAAAIALAAPVLTYRATVRLDRDRWVRQRRAEAYIEALAILGRIAAHVTEPASRPDPFKAVPGDQWRQFQARVEAFASTSVIALRDSLLTAWERYRVAAAAAAEPGNPEAEVRAKEADGHRSEVRELYADLISRVREELRQDRDPWWRRLGTRRGQGAGARLNRLPALGPSAVLPAPAIDQGEQEMAAAFLSARTGFGPQLEDRTLRGQPEPWHPGACRRR